MEDIKINGESQIWDHIGLDACLHGDPRLRGQQWWISDGKNYLPSPRLAATEDLWLDWEWCEKLYNRGIKRITVGRGSPKRGGKIFHVRFCGGVK